eukprot:CAMPEP_0117442404 /NCGR_PEP_ID=MMETSP0759-20121206/4132_1 /TAXON_ID=63605 /ORGANISM="Percolomonas cosmopolitus, Strain WS" /LENGTH=1473 /DNA_ID=CAMNT_0005234287 /DNA_START=356 /DNA_END=4777 /DNA_ORIENTATION=+
MRDVETTKDLFVSATKNGYHLRYWDTTLPIKNLDYVGRGYNIRVGNPEEATVGGDKGYKQPIFKIDTTSEEENTFDWSFVKGKKVDLLVKVACQTEVSLTEISTKESLMSDSSKAVSDFTSVSASVSSGSFKASAGVKMTDSDTTKKMVGTLEDKTKTIVKSSAECTVYEETINLFDMPEFHPDFKEILDNLQKTYDGNSKKYYHRIFDTYGTHVVMQVLMGSRYGKYYTIDRTTLEQINSDEKTSESTTDITVEAGVEGLVGGYETSTGHSKSNSKEKENSIGNSASNTAVFSIGADYNEDPVEWASQSATNPFPLSVKVLPLSFIIRKHYSEQIATNLDHALLDYTPSGSGISTGFDKCYMTSSANEVYNKRNKRTTLIARCRPGFTAMGGTYTHLWNYNGDIVVDALSTASEKMLEDLKKYHAIRTQEQAVNYLVDKGSDMVNQFVDASTKDHLKEIFGDRVDPNNVARFLSGKLKDLNIEKKGIAGAIATGLKLFGNNAVGDLANNFLSKSPLANSIMKVKDSFVKDIAEARTLSVGEQEEAELQKTYKHADTLVQVINTLANDAGFKKDLIPSDNALTQGFFTDLADSAKKIISSISGAIDNVQQKLDSSPVVKFMTTALDQWKNFSGNIEDVMNKFSSDIDKSKDRIQSTDLYQDTITDVRKQSNPHGKTLLATRNALNWLFPYKKDSWMCGGGAIGFEATSHSGMGVCSAFCCSDAHWDVETKMQGLRTVDKEKMTSESVAACPLGSTVISGGVLISDHQEGRFVQVVTSRPEGNDAWKCVVKWSEEEYNAVTPKFQCYAKCVVSTPPASCNTVSEPLVNGHATARCASHQMAMSGGWDIQSVGITYFKKTEFRNVHPVQGPLGFRCEMGSSHNPLTGSCMARCCNVKAEGVSDQIEKDETCTPFWDRTRVAKVGDFYQMRPWGDKVEDLGSVLRYGEEMLPHKFMVSRNGKYFMRFEPAGGSLLIYEDFECEDPHQIGHIWIDPHQQCFSSRSDKFLRSLITSFHEQFLREQQRPRRRNHIMWGLMPRMMIHRMFRRLPRSFHRFLPRGMFQRISPRPMSIHELAKKTLSRFDVSNDNLWEYVKRGRDLQEFVRSGGGIRSLMSRYAGHNLPHEPRLRVTQNGVELYFQDSGDVCATAEFAAGTVETMQLFDNGDLNFVDDEKQSLHVLSFDECRLFYRRHKLEKSQLNNGETIFLNGGIISPNKEYVLWFLPGGGLAVIRQVKTDDYCKRPHLIWTTAKDAHGGNIITDFHQLDEFNREIKEGWSLRLQENNNLVMFDDRGQGVWESGTAGRGLGAATLEISNNGQIRLMDAVGVDLWTPHKGPIKSCVTLRERLKIRSHRAGAGSTFRPGEGGLVSKNAQYVMFIEHDQKSSQNNLELWREGGDDCKPARVMILKSNINELAITPRGLMNGDQMVFRIEGDIPVNEMTLSNSAEIWIHGGHDHRREISKQWHFLPGDPKQIHA